jgi:hypothetical protein
LALPLHHKIKFKGYYKTDPASKQILQVIIALALLTSPEYSKPLANLHGDIMANLHGDIIFQTLVCSKCTDHFIIKKTLANAK